MHQAYIQVIRYAKYAFIFLLLSWLTGILITLVVYIMLEVMHELGLIAVDGEDVVGLIAKSRTYFIAIPVVLELPFIGMWSRDFYLDLVVAPRQREQALQREWRTLANEEKLLRHVEANLNPQAVAHLSKSADLTYQRESDGVTYTMATVRYLGGNYQNTAWRPKTLDSVCSNLLVDLRKSVLNKQDKNGYTALMYAAEQSDNQSISLLLKYGAVSEKKNNAGKTALDLARKWPSTVALIEDGNAEQAAEKGL